MPFSIVVQDISKMKVDAIVNTTNRELICAGFGVDFSIHQTAGPELQEECLALAPCDICDVRVTGAYNLPCKIVIHTVAPYYDGTEHSQDQLNLCFENVLRAAVDNRCKSIAVPLIGTGNNGFPIDSVLLSATEISKRFLEENDLSISLVVYNRGLFNPTLSFIPDDFDGPVSANYIHAYREEYSLKANAYRPRPSFFRPKKPKEEPSIIEPDSDDLVECDALYHEPAPTVCGSSLNSAFIDYDIEDIPEDELEVDESFGQLVTRLAEKYYDKTSEFYVAANITKSVYSKMKTVPTYVPSRSTALACAVVLKSKGVDENELLRHAGMVLTNSDKRDKIILAAFNHDIYDVFTINEALFKYDLPLLGYRA